MASHNPYYNAGGGYGYAPPSVWHGNGMPPTQPLGRTLPAQPMAGWASAVSPYAAVGAASGWPVQNDGGVDDDGGYWSQDDGAESDGGESGGDVSEGEGWSEDEDEGAAPSVPGWSGGYVSAAPQNPYGSW